MVFRRWLYAVFVALAVAGMSTCNGNMLLDIDSGAAPRGATLEEIGLRGIWMVGGQRSNYTSEYPYHADLVSALDLYDPLTNEWYQAVTQLPLPVTFAGAAAFAGKIYVSGGFDSSGTARNELQVYDVATGTWSFGTSLPEPRAMHQLVYLDGYLYAMHGTNVNQDSLWTYRNQALRYEVATEAWMARYQLGYMDSAVASIGGIIHYIGGRNSATASYSYHEGYWPQLLPATTDTNTSSTTEVVITLLYPGCDAFVAADGSAYILLTGGIAGNLAGTTKTNPFNGLSTPSTQLDSNLRYLKAPYETPAAWITYASSTLPAGRAFNVAKVVEDKLYVFGGTTVLPVPSASSDVFVLDLAGFPGSGNSYTAGPPMPSSRFGHQAVRNIE